MFVVKPNVTCAALALRGLGDHKRQTVAVGRELQIGNTTQVQGSRGSQRLEYTGLGRLLRKSGRRETRENKQSADR